MSDWVIGVIVFLLFAIVAHGIFIKMRERRNRIDVSPALKRRLRASDSDDYEDETPPSYVSELPNGGARVVGKRNPEDIAQSQRKLTARELKEQRREEAAKKRMPEQTRLNLDESVPMLMESVAQEDTARVEPRFSEHPAEDFAGYDEQEDHQADYDEEEEYSEDYDDEYEEDFDVDNEEDDDIEEDDLEEDEPEQRQSAAPDEVLVINIMAPKGQAFAGSDLLDIVLKCGLRYGDMDIFHRYSDTKGEGALLFSMANMVKPGTFDLDSMDYFSTPGISLFMTLPIAADSLKSFDLMVETAQAISQTLHGELKDEQRSAMTRQTLEHMRARIQDYERKKLFRRPR